MATFKVLKVPLHSPHSAINCWNGFGFVNVAFDGMLTPQSLAQGYGYLDKGFDSWNRFIYCYSECSTCFTTQQFWEAHCVSW